MEKEIKTILEINLPGLKLVAKVEVLGIDGTQVMGKMTYFVNDHEVDYWNCDPNKHILILYNQSDFKPL